MSTTVETTTEIRPFQIEIADEKIDDLRRRIAATRWPEKETVDDQSQGPRLATMQALARYWAEEYDWRKCEERLKALPHFITEIDGLDIHFIHVRSEHEDALPLLVSHGWPGSVIEQLKIIDPLTNPTAHGASASDAFHLVIPSMPGYGFSGKPTTTGWGPEHIARAWAELMKRLGYDRYVASGGDWGGQIVDADGCAGASGVARHPHQLPWCCSTRRRSGGPVRRPAPSGLDDEETRLYEKLKLFFATDAGYAIEMRDPPAGALRNCGFTRRPGRLDARPRRDQFGADRSRLCRRGPGRPYPRRRARQHHPLLVDEHGGLFGTPLLGKQGRLLRPEGLADRATTSAIVDIPVAVSVFPDEIYTAPRSWAEEAYPKLIHYNKLDKGGHFAAWEQPKLFSEEVRAGLRSLR